MMRIVRLSYHVLPLDPLEVLLIQDNEVITGDEDVEGRVTAVQLLSMPVLTQDLPLLLCALVRELNKQNKKRKENTKYIK